MLLLGVLAFDCEILLSVLRHLLILRRSVGGMFAFGACSCCFGMVVAVGGACLLLICCSNVLRGSFV